MEQRLSPEPVLELIDGFRRSQVLFAAARLGIFDGVRPQAPELERLLEACLSLGLLEKDGAAYRNTPLADRYLRADSPNSLAGYVRQAWARLYPSWARLAATIMNGLPLPELDYQGDLMRGMQGFGMLSSPQVAASFDFSRFQTFWDLGGSTGHLALAMQERHPQLKIGIFDLPEVIQRAAEFTGGKAMLQGGNLLIDPLPAADLYGLGKVLHNYTDAVMPVLLDKIHAALPADGALLVVERLLDEDRQGPAHVHLSSLNILVASRGRERRFSDYRAHLEKAGFRDVKLAKTGGLVDAILAFKQGAM